MIHAEAPFHASIATASATPGNCFGPEMWWSKHPDLEVPRPLRITQIACKARFTVSVHLRSAGKLACCQ